jgi:CubicO group peptidase (beta-lactamase class C family)
VNRVLATGALALAACAGPPPPPEAPAPSAPPEAHSLPIAPPAELGFDTAGLRRVATYLASEVDSAFPGAVVAVGRHGQLVLLEAVGHYAADDPRPVEPGTIYDLASLTKVVGLTTACLLLVSEGRLDLDAPVRRYVPSFRGGDRDRVTIRHLLTHASGLPAWAPLYRARDRRAVFATIDTTTLLRAPGDTFVYSDLGAILLTHAVERITGQRLDRWLADRVFTPLGMGTTRYRPPASLRPFIAPTERDTAFRRRMLHGEVHDENAGRMDGVSGHAGVFSNAPDLARYAVWILERSTEHSAQSRMIDSQRVLRAPCSVLCLPTAVVRSFVTRQDIPRGSTRALGWDTPSDSGYSSAGTMLSRRSIGHTGFTGTSIWMDPDRDLFVILLTNRVNPTRANTRILRVRARVADLVAQALVDPST